MYGTTDVIKTGYFAERTGKDSVFWIPSLERPAGENLGTRSIKERMPVAPLSHSALASRVFASLTCDRFLCSLCVLILQPCMSCGILMCVMEQSYRKTRLHMWAGKLPFFESHPVRHLVLHIANTHAH